MSKIVLNDVFNEWLNSKGILNVLTNNFEVPWKGTVAGDVLDLEYHGNHSGQKIIAPLVEKLITEDGISDENARKLAGVIYYRNITNWNKLWDTLSFEYDPIANVDAHEVTKSHKGEQTDKFTQGEQENTFSHGEHETDVTIGSQSVDKSIGAQSITEQKGAQHTEVESSIAGFNSSDYSNADKSITDANAFQNSTNLGSHSDKDITSGRNDKTTVKAFDDSSTYGERIDETVSGERDDEVELIRKGNIGVTTSQQMITQERILWDWKFFDRVFEDIDSILVIDIYGEFHGSCEGLVINTNSYILPIANENTLGGVKPLTKSDLMTMAVGVDAQGRLWTIPSSSTSEVTSVNGQKGDVTLHAGDVGAPTKAELSTVANALNGLSTVVNNISDEVEGISDDIDNINTELPNKYSPANQPPYPVTSVNGMTGDVIVQGGGGGAVDSVNGKTGAVILNNSDVGAPSLDEFQTFEDDFDDFKSETNESLGQKYSPTNTPPYPVTSVNGQTGAVTGLYDENNQPPYPVTSVNGMTGDVVVQGGGGSASKLYSVEITSSDTRESAYNKIAELLGDSLAYWSAIPIFGMFIDTYENVFWVVNSITIQNYGYFGVSLSCHKPDGGSQGFSFDTYDASNPFPAKKLILYFVK